MKNIELVKTILTALKQMQISDVIVCAGARNVPLVLGLETAQFNLISYFEERSAAFYALGKSKATGRPVAIVTTSGTAVAEALPAVIEAYYQNIPLVVLTADRPKSYRGSGAPQAIEQKDIFQGYVESAVDWDISQKDFTLSFSGHLPVHINICFDEPLIDGGYEKANYEKVATAPIKISKKIDLVGVAHAMGVVSQVEAKNPFVIISELPEDQRGPVIQFLQKNKAFHCAEFLSGLHNHPDLQEYQTSYLDGFSDLKNKYGFESVVRIGGVPTHRFWRDLEGKYKDLPVYHYSQRPFSGLSRSASVNPISNLQYLKIKCTEDFDLQLALGQNQKLLKVKNELLKQHRNSELDFIHKLSEIVSEDAVYIGNSLPIREWDLVSMANQNARQSVFAHRGANGIDGQISGYLGWSEQKKQSWCVVGDLTALYDLAALGLHQSAFSSRIIIINNSGGQIFNRIFGHSKYLNAQKVNFSGWAQLWGWDYIKITESEALKSLKSNSSKKIIVEIVCDNQQTAAFWNDWDTACRS